MGRDIENMGDQNKDKENNIEVIESKKKACIYSIRAMRTRYHLIGDIPSSQEPKTSLRQTTYAYIRTINSGIIYPMNVLVA